jgi:hypothetical protein
MHTLPPHGVRVTANTFAFVAVAMLGAILGRIDSLAQNLVSMKGAIVLFFGTTQACKLLMLILNQVSCRTHHM